MEWIAGKSNRLDLFLSIESRKSRSFVKHQILKGRVSVESSVITKPSFTIKPGNKITAQFIENDPIHLIPIKKDLNILYEDSDIIVINKEQGWVVHPATSYSGETVVHYLLSHLSDSTTTDPIRPGIVHRLDKGTSGCLLIAKNRTALEILSKQFKDRIVQKEYEAITWGNTKNKGIIKNQIGRHHKHRKKISSKTKKGRDAETYFETLASYQGFSWVKLCPKTGRTHQLRVHLSENANAIVGDRTYSRKRDLKQFSPPLKLFLETKVKHPFLHAKKLQFIHPVSQKIVVVEAAPPKVFSDFLTLLQNKP